MSRATPFIVNLIVVAMLGVPVSADVDYTSTQAGFDSPTGTRDFWDVDAIDRLLMTFNEKLTWKMTLSSEPSQVLEAQPYERQFTLGEIMHHSGNTKLIYDRLAVRVVVRVLGFDDGSLPPGDDDRYFAITHDKQIIGLPSPPAIGGSGARPQSALSRDPSPPASVPEPATGMVLALAAAAALGSRRTRMGKITA